MATNQVIFDPSSLIKEKSLVFAGKDNKNKKFGVVIPITQTFEAFSWEVTIIKGFEFTEIAKRDFGEEGIFSVIGDPTLYCFDDIDVIGNVNDADKMQQTRIDILKQININLVKQSNVC